ncbi:helix-turn-helix transcriptional regulator [Bacillus sp. H-16]|uniref:winged helix-turn-helix domain-containing protein n=1 Tax=Alteribacter salitolerans TaxID=2912333 RepID=UPI00196558D9|nr:winged helix-turn-helix domain-containing protein [Alteribacter salitolerans]MBM7094518.1 helix-turn-helix transcriptional regulator [Alteribacter salitolerans]
MAKPYIINDIEQLKVISVPIRIKILWEIFETPRTGKMIGDLLDTPPSKIHYHLKELERVGLIYVESTEEKNGIVQKFYKTIAPGFQLGDVLPQQEGVVLSDSLKENIVTSLDKTKSIVKRGEEELSAETFNYFTTLKLTQEKYDEVRNKFREIAKFLMDQKDADTSGKKGNEYHFNFIGLPAGNKNEGEEEHE